MSETRYKLHPIAAVISFVKGLKDLLFPMIVLIFLGGGTEDAGLFKYFPYLFGGLALIFYLVTGFIKWWKFKYWFEDGELRIEYGLIVKNKRYIPFERIQSLDYTESIFHRPFGLVKVKIETAGGSGLEADAELTAIRLQEANRIKEAMQQAKQQVTTYESEEEHERQPVEPLESILHTMSTKDLLVLAMTSGGIGIFFSGVAVLVSQFSELIPYEWIYAELIDFLRFGFVLVSLTIFFVLLIAFLFSVVMTFLQNYQFTVALVDGELLLRRGLLEKKRTTVPINRIQSIQMVENPFRQLFGYVTIIVDSAGGGGDLTNDTIKLVPLIKKSEAILLLQTLFEQFDWEPEFIRPPKRARKFYYRIGTLILVAVGTALSYFFFPYGLLFFLTVPLSIVFGLWNHRTTGLSLHPTYAVFQYRAISRKTIWMEKRRIQSVTVSQSYFENRADVASVNATIKSGVLGSTHTLRALNNKEAREMADWYLPNR